MSDQTSTQDPVLFEERQGQHGAVIGIATLNAPHVLNGLSLQMVDLLAARLTAWAQDPAVAVVVLCAAGEKAFCAGGDLHGLYASATATPRGKPWANEGARRFFENEYRLDYQIHHYPKPILCWGHGIVMGGGMGLMMGASHRVVTPASRMAMPEISIGLFPDVGGSWLLSRMPGKLGLFLGLTAAPVNAADALNVGWADVMLAHTAFDTVLQSLQDARWALPDAQGAHAHRTEGRGTELEGTTARRIDVQGTDVQDSGAPDQPVSRVANDATLTRILQDHAEPTPEDGPLSRHAALINERCAGDDLQKIGEAVGALADHSDPWLARAAATYLKGAPGSARLAFEFGRRARLMSLADVFRMEYVGVLAALAYGDVTEGIRALLIDKDKNPKWQPATLAQADEAWVSKFFEAPWPPGQSHPLADLGAGAAP
ncbi:MAG: enoyl-CoA hydratase/isomerase family protein [Burkholderiaceae bacterium]